MGHQDKGSFAAKHKESKIDKTIADRLKKMATDNSITCASAHQAAKLLNLLPSEIGIQIDLLEFRITECQLGLFGYGNEKKRINPEIAISPEVEGMLENTASDGKISCLACWDIAGRQKMKRLDMGSVCEKKNIRIKPCQLGSF